MVRLYSMLFAVSSLALPSLLSAATECAHPYEKVFPYDLPLGNEQAYVAVHSEVRLSFDCQSALARAGAEAKTGIFDLDLDLLQANVEARAQQGQVPGASARVLILGFEVAREDVDLSDLVNVSISPEPELDLSGSLVIDVGPVPVPVKYGVLANAELNIKGAGKGFGLALQLLPLADAKIYLQAGLDVDQVEIIAHGDVNLIHDQLDNELALGFEASDRGYVRFDASSKNQIQALDGNVKIRVSLGTGADKQGFERDLLNWDGFQREDLVLDFSDRVVILP